MPRKSVAVARTGNEIKDMLTRNRVSAIRDNVIVLPDEDPDMIGNIVIPESSVELKKFTGTVISTGDGHITDQGVTIPLSVYPGDRVVYSRYAGSFIEHEGKQLLILRESDINAVIVPKPGVSR